MLDLQQPPYVPYVELLEALRRDPAARDAVAFSEAQAEGRGTYDAHEQERARVTHLLRLSATPEDVALIRFLLDQEITARRADSFQGAGDTLSLLSLLLLELGDGELEDTWRFWQAKRANFDTFAGGYDIEFVFSLHPPQQALALIEARGEPGDLDMLSRYDAEEIVRGLAKWRASLARRFPRRLDDLSTMACELWAELFGDLAGMERYGLLNATTPSARGYLYRRLGRPADAVVVWRAAAAAATTAWDRASLLQSALTDAAKVPLDATDEATRLDALRHDIPNWNVLGLGRMSTQACYEAAAALDDPEAGRRLWRMAERWRADLDSFMFNGLCAAIAAAERWGDASDVASLREAARAERARIDEELGQ